MLGLIMVAGMVPGLLIGLQRTTAIDYDAVAYRTGAILAEDSGWTDYAFSGLTSRDWELSNQVNRIGLAVNKESPNILSMAKIGKFCDPSIFPSIEDYRKKVIFGDYPYRFSISLKNESVNFIQNCTFNQIPDRGSYGYIKRVVKIKGESYDILDLNTTSCNNTYCTSYFNEINLINQTFNITFNLSALLNKNINPAYRYDPRVEPINITIFNFNKTLNYNSTFRNGIFDYPYAANLTTWNDTIGEFIYPTYATLTNVTFHKNDGLALPFDYENFANDTYKFNIDGRPSNLSPNSKISDNLSLILYPGNLPLDEGTKLDVRFTFHDEYNGTTIARTLISGSHEVIYSTGKANDTFVQNKLTDAWLEVAVW